LLGAVFIDVEARGVILRTNIEARGIVLRTDAKPGQRSRRDPAFGTWQAEAYAGRNLCLRRVGIRLRRPIRESAVERSSRALRQAVVIDVEARHAVRSNAKPRQVAAEEEIEHRGISD
jgi:hypothetical protein